MAHGVHGVITHLAAQLVEEDFKSDIGHALEVTDVTASFKILNLAIKKNYVSMVSVGVNFAIILSGTFVPVDLC